jgi:serine/threonine protein kinase
MHRDFKLANVLLHNGICKIADLGFAKQMKKDGALTTTILGTSLTMAPEVLDERPYGMEADLWSIGVVYYQMIYGKYPYVGLNDFDILKKIKNYRPDYSAIKISS